MPIKYFPNRIFKKPEPAIDRVMAKRSLKTVSGSQNIATEALDVRVTTNSDWYLDSIALQFSNSTSRDYYVSVLNGVKIVKDYNDFLWFGLASGNIEKIILDAGFYTGTELAAHLKAKMDANAGFAARGITFTVTYSSVNGTFTITPSSDQIKYYDQVNTVLSEYQSIAGYLFGFTNTTSYETSIVSDTNVYALDFSTDLINTAASTETNYYNDDSHVLTIDQTILLSSNAGSNVDVAYNIVYEDMV